MSPPNILLVDDQREVTRMLRAALELAIPQVVVAEVPSAEEAMLEVQRVAFDLVVTDILLPGVDGLELMRRVRQSRPTAGLIVITGHLSAEVEAQVERLEADALFAKPINTNEFLEAVLRSLGHDVAGLADEKEDDQPGVSERLLSLRQDLGALAVYLADIDGHIVVRAGDVPELDVEAMMVHIEVAFAAAFRVCTILGGYVPLNMHFFDGDEFDVYVANIGKTFILLMIFDGERGAQQMGSVMHYGRKAADDLLNLLTAMGVSELSEYMVSEPEPEPVSASEPAGEQEPGAEPVEPAIEPIELDLDVLEAAAAKLGDVDADDFWEAALAETAAESMDSNSLSFEQAQKLGLAPVDEE